MPIDPDEAIQKIYYHELERRRTLFRRLSIPAGVLTVLAGAIGFLIQRGTDLPDLAWFIPYATLLVIGIFWFAQGLLAVFDSVRGVSLPGTVDPLMIDVAVDQGGDAVEISRVLAGSLATAAASLRRANDERENKLFDSYQSMFFCTSSLVFAYAIYLAHTVSVYLIRTQGLS